LEQKCGAFVDRLLHKALGPLLFSDAAHPKDVQQMLIAAIEECGGLLAQEKHPMQRECGTAIARKMLDHVGMLCVDEEKRQRANTYFTEEMLAYSKHLHRRMT
jgi:hypothetical protein